MSITLPLNVSVRNVGGAIWNRKIRSNAYGEHGENSRDLSKPRACFSERIYWFMFQREKAVYLVSGVFSNHQQWLLKMGQGTLVKAQTSLLLTLLNATNSVFADLLTADTLYQTDPFSGEVDKYNALHEHSY